MFILVCIMQVTESRLTSRRSDGKLVPGSNCAFESMNQSVMTLGKLFVVGCLSMFRVCSLYFCSLCVHKISFQHSTRTPVFRTTCKICAKNIIERNIYVCSKPSCVHVHSLEGTFLSVSLSPSSNCKHGNKLKSCNGYWPTIQYFLIPVYLVYTV